MSHKGKLNKKPVVLTVYQGYLPFKMFIATENTEALF